MNFQDGNDTDMSSRREESITAVMLGPRECELTDELGNIYGINLDSSTSNNGDMICKPGGTFIGPVNATIFISGKYGKSQVDGAYSINSKNQMFVYHTLPEITSVSPNTGGDAGGTYVTIKGNTFDSMKGKTQVMIGDTPCNIISISNEELTCSTPAQADLSGNNAGARGLLYEVWTATEDANVTDTSAADYNSMVVDGSKIDGAQFNETNGYTARLSGLFVAPYTGKISFYLQSSDAATLYLSTDSDPANKVAIVENSGKQTSAKKGQPHSSPVELVKGEEYYIEATHVQASSSASENFLAIALWEHVTPYHASQLDNAIDEHQVLNIEYERQFETQEVRFNNMNESAEITFTHAGIPSKAAVGMADKSTWDQTWLDMFTYSCEYQYTNHHLKQDYENTNYNLPGAGGYMNENVQAYCGARAMENQGRLTATYGASSHLNAKRYPWLCFAARGTTYQGIVQLLVRWEDTSERDRRDWVWVRNVWEPSDDWSYSCLNLEEAVKNPNNSWVANHLHSSSKIDIEDIILRTGSYKGPYHVDEVTISRAEVPIIRTQQYIQSSFNQFLKEGSHHCRITFQKLYNNPLILKTN